MSKLGKRRGNALIEFTLVGIPVIFLTISVFSISIDMWEFHELPYAVEMTARYAATHGQGCAQSGNTCSITVAKMVTYFEAQNISLIPSLVNVTFTDGSGSTSCAPLSNCAASATTFPHTGYNAPGQDITVYATYTLKNPIAMFWPPTQSAVWQNFTVSATSRQRILF
jgi:Flp pilus assembly protein TadG